MPDTDNMIDARANTLNPSNHCVQCLWNISENMTKGNGAYMFENHLEGEY